MRIAYANARSARELAEFVARTDPAIFAATGIDAGDAFALATRFARQWAYRGAQALFWSDAFRAHEVHDRYLPMTALRPFDRRGLLLVDGEFEGRALSLVATQLGATRDTFVREARFAREQVRERSHFLLFAHHHAMRTDLRGRDIVELARDADDALHVYARGASADDFNVRFMSS